MTRTDTAFVVADGMAVEALALGLASRVVPAEVLPAADGGNGQGIGL